MVVVGRYAMTVFEGAAQQRASDYIKRISPGASQAVQDAKDKLDQAGLTGYLKLIGGGLFTWGIKKMAPQLAAGLTEVSGYLSTAQKALKAWPAIAAAMVTAGAWDLDTLQANRAAVVAYERDKKRRELDVSAATVQADNH